MFRKDLFFRFNGRIGRMTFFKGGLYLLGLYILVLLLGFLLLVTAKALGGIAAKLFAIPAIILCLAWFVAILWMGSALTVKRLHDLNRSGWLFALYVAAGAVVGVLRAPGEAQGLQALGAVLGSILTVGWLIWTVFIRGTNGVNRFGSPDPTVPGKLVTNGNTIG